MQFICRVVVVLFFSSVVWAVPPRAPNMTFQPTLGGEEAIVYLVDNDVRGHNIYIDGEYHDTVFVNDSSAAPRTYLLPDNWCMAYVTAFNNFNEHSPRSREIQSVSCGGSAQIGATPGGNPPNIGTIPDSIINPPTTAPTVTPVAPTTGELCIETIVRRDGAEIDRSERCY